VKRREYIREIERQIGSRKLVWFGILGGNAHPLTPIAQFSEAYSVIAPGEVPGAVCIERLSGERVDTVGYQLQPDQSEIHGEFYRRLYSSLSEPAVAVTHEASRFFASAYFLRQEYVRHLGLFNEWQVVFDHKPWVESELRKIGVSVVPWRYLSTHDHQVLRSALEEAVREGPIVIRTNRSGGGDGLTLVRQLEDIPPGLPDRSPDGFLAVAPFFESSVPLNVNACVFPDGAISLHSPSLQLIGIPGSALNGFGYCGNDFARIKDMEDAALRAFEEMTIQAGRWLSSMGYIGAFGVDALVHEGRVYLTEVNPRYQGSSLLSAHLEAALDRPDVFLAHAGAFLGVPAPDPWPLATLAREQPRAAQIVTRNNRPEPVVMRGGDRRPPAGVDCWLLPDPGVAVQPRALLCRAVVWDAVTEDGWRLRGDVASWFATLPEMLFEVAAPARAAASTI
jgi:hypothetical protein